MKLALLLTFSAFTVVTFVLAQSSSSSLQAEFTAQNRDTVRVLYGNPISEVYKTPNNMVVTASFAPDGNLCRVRIESAAEAVMKDSELTPVLDALAPTAVRGTYKMGTFLHITCMKQDKNGKMVEDPCTECSGVSEEYERLTIAKFGSTNEYRSATISFRRPECEGVENAHK